VAHNRSMQNASQMPVIYIINMTTIAESAIGNKTIYRTCREGVCRWLAASPNELRPMAAHNATLTNLTQTIALKLDLF
jgi:hypothetical protein